MVPWVTTPENDATLGPLEDLLDVLDLKPVGSAHITISAAAGALSMESDIGEYEADVFIGRSQPMPHGRVFGGQVLAQSVIAAGRTVADLEGAPRRIHSLHGYFLRPGDADHRIRFAVQRLRDGHSFSVRRVQAIQNGQPILSMITSFQTDAVGLDHQDHMPAAPDPERMETLAEVFAGLDNPHALAWSDRRLRVASLDHAMWFHRPGRADDWTLYTQSSPSASGGRGLATGRMFNSDGVLLATVAQEGMMRLKDS